MLTYICSFNKAEKTIGKVLLMNPALIIIIILVLGVVFVNGWTDAPNAIATVVSTRGMSPRSAVLMAAVLNFLGVLVMTHINAKVAFTIGNMVSFGSGHDSLVALAAALVAIVVWAVAAWYFGIPTSESHALIAGLTGAALTMDGLSSVNGQEWIKVLYGLGISSVLGFISGYFVVKLVAFLFKDMKRRNANVFFRWAQVVAAGFMAFLHGAQDGQKFIGVFMMGILLAKGLDMPAAFDVPFWILVLCSVTMGIGTSVGGYRIIKAVGMDMVKLEKYQGFSADIAASICLLISTLTGIPVSTTHTKTTAIMGVGASRRMSMVNWGVVKEMVLAWVLTFPACGLIGYIMAKIFLKVFV